MVLGGAGFDFFTFILDGPHDHDVGLQGSIRVDNIRQREGEREPCFLRPFGKLLDDTPLDYRCRELKSTTGADSCSISRTKRSRSHRQDMRLWPPKISFELQILPQGC